MGLSGTGKTTLAEQLVAALYDAGIESEWYNADKVREETRNFNFSRLGRMAQAAEMQLRAKRAKAPVVICDFIAPTEEVRMVFDADYTVWLDTNKESNYADTDELFVPPSANYIITEYNDIHVKNIINDIQELINE